MAPPAARARMIDCVVQPQPPQGACYAPVWVNGQQIIMTFPQAGHPVHNVPSAKQQPFYILAPQTGTAQGQTRGFFHDHVITTAPSEGGFTPFLHGYLVICRPQGISTGACTYNVETLLGVYRSRSRSRSRAMTSGSPRTSKPPPTQASSSWSIPGLCS